jgi:hypothetical protein
MTAAAPDIVPAADDDRGRCQRRLAVRTFLEVRTASDEFMRTMLVDRMVAIAGVIGPDGVVDAIVEFLLPHFPLHDRAAVETIDQVRAGGDLSGRGVGG